MCTTRSERRLPEGVWIEIGNFLQNDALDQTLPYCSRVTSIFLLTTDGPTDGLANVSVYKMWWLFKYLIKCIAHCSYFIRWLNLSKETCAELKGSMQYEN